LEATNVIPNEVKIQGDFPKNIELKGLSVAKGAIKDASKSHTESRKGMGGEPRFLRSGRVIPFLQNDP